MWYDGRCPSGKRINICLRGISYLPNRGLLSIRSNCTNHSRQHQQQTDVHSERENFTRLKYDFCVALLLPQR